jgi:hypothetical protein
MICLSSCEKDFDSLLFSDQLTIREERSKGLVHTALCIALLYSIFQELFGLCPVAKQALQYFPFFKLFFF